MKIFVIQAYAYSIDGKINLYNNRLKFDGQSVISKLNENKNGYGHSYELSYSDKIKSRISLFNNSIIEFWTNYEQFFKRL